MSDAHANPAALEKAIKDAKKEKCERFIFLGDVTGYGYDVKGAWELVNDNFDIILLGNHDSVCIGKERDPLADYIPNYDIDRAQQSELPDEAHDILWEAPYLHKEKGAAFAHGNFSRPDNWGYVFTLEEARQSFFSRPEKLMFCGHTHIARSWEMGKDEMARENVVFKVPATKPEKKSFNLKEGKRYIVNVGSVGYPRNDLCSTYVIWDSEKERVTFRRLPFDFMPYIKALLDKNIDLPMWLSDLLLAATKGDYHTFEGV